MSELDPEVVENLKKSRETIGEIDPVLLSSEGGIIDGAHRLKAYPGWKTVSLKVDRKKALLLRLHRNYRRSISREETKKMLNELALILQNEGTPQEQIAQEIAKLSPYTEAYTLSLLPKKFKQPKAVKAAKATYKILYGKEEEKVKAEAKAKTEKEAKLPPKLICPICGST
ncbi:MAG: hypothetical protein ACUVTE_07825, partial [Candidatus Bathycorpusculaceae bacterium]